MENIDLGVALCPLDSEQIEESESLIFLNRIAEYSQKNSFNDDVQEPHKKILERIERLAVILWHDKFDEVEAAMYLRLPDPYNTGADTIRYHALRSRKLSFHKIGKNGLIFTKTDLDKALKLFKLENHRDL